MVIFSVNVGRSVATVILRSDPSGIVSCEPMESATGLDSFFSHKLSPEEWMLLHLPQCLVCFDQFVIVFVNEKYTD